MSGHQVAAADWVLLPSLLTQQSPESYVEMCWMHLEVHKLKLVLAETCKRTHQVCAALTDVQGFAVPVLKYLTCLQGPELQNNYN